MASKRVRVGVVGGGAAGVIATRWLREAGHEVVLFEKASELGGVWRYEDATNTDASMYKSLRTNLPTSVMQLDDFPFPPGLRSFPSHTDVLEYIQSYARHFHVTDVARLQSTVLGVSKTLNADDENAKAWRIDVESPQRGAYSEEVDKVLICNGHFASPSYPQIPGIEHFKGEILHSHNYRKSDPYKNKTVVLLGCGPSGQDISLELQASGAKQVVVSFQEFGEKDPSPLDKRTLKPAIARILEDGTFEFTDGTTLPPPDVLMYCTGYLYIVKSLVPKGILYPELPLPQSELGVELASALEETTASHAAIAPLYKQFFSIEEPDIAFVGLPFRNLPFLSFELQTKWAARVFSGESTLPSKQQMYESFFDDIRTLPFAVRKMHMLGLDRQKNYFEELASFSDTKVNRNVQEMFSDAGFIRFTYPFHYREAEYTQEPSQDGKWVRRLTLTDAQGHPTEELVHVFE